MTEHDQYQMPQLPGPHSTAISPRMVLPFGEFNFPYWGFDTLIDGRADALWTFCMTIEDAQTLADAICRNLGLPKVELVAPDLPPGVVKERVDALREDGILFECIIELVSDGEYFEQCSHGSPAMISFEPVLTDRGEQIPLQLVLHELAHHVEWHEVGDLSGHDAQPFIDALPVVIDHACELLGLSPDFAVAAIDRPHDVKGYDIRMSAYRERYAAWVPRSC